MLEPLEKFMKNFGGLPQSRPFLHRKELPRFFGFNPRTHPGKLCIFPVLSCRPNGGGGFAPDFRSCSFRERFTNDRCAQ